MSADPPLTSIKPVAEPRDYFHRGVVGKLFPNNNMGVIRSESGREIPFSYEFVIMLGEIHDPALLQEGQEVGYDVGWTSVGLRVTKIKTYPLMNNQRSSTSSEGERGQSQNLSPQDLADKDP
jgi:hypothetical protein